MQGCDLGDSVGGERLPHAQRQPFAFVDPPEHGCRAEPAVLVVDRSDAAAVGEPDALACGADPLVLVDGDEPLAELPGGLLPQNASRLTRRVTLDDAACDVEVATGKTQCRRVQPERV